MAGQNGPISIPAVVEHVEEVCNTENVDALHLGKYQHLYSAKKVFAIDQNTYGSVNQSKRFTLLKKRCAFVLTSST